MSENGNTVPQPVPQMLKPTLLIVDDEEGPRQSLRVVFKDDYNLLLANDGPSAIEMARRQPVDVAVLDIRMGGMSGIELLEHLKAADPAIEVVMMTAFETADTIRQALRLQACDYINKPFDISTIRDAVANAVKRRSLASEVKNNAEKLQALQSELQQQRLQEQIARTRGEIYASIIHDINGPLTIISGLIQVINQRIGDETELAGEELEHVKERLKRITRQVTACIEISRRYLGFLRQHHTDNIRVWVNQMLADFRELLWAHPLVKDNQLVIQPLPEDVTVHINGTDLLQILLNLTINALQCSPQAHRVEIVGRVLTQPLDLRMFVDGATDRFVNREGLKNAAPLLALSVQDNGPGISSGVLPRLFEPYFTTRPAASGTGLGLCIVHRLLKEANGALHVHSKPGQGTVFTVYFPARLPSAADATPSFSGGAAI
ncbi:MAG: response regulator [Verrucomicrobia subdivision 3 bacterium]|nr:response regulator [Limisphaerales bacterium]